MAINLLKTAAGLQDADQLIIRQVANKFAYGGKPATFAYTRYVPKRAEEILQTAGSIYWILKNRIQVRQRILGFELVQEEGEKDWCKIVVDPQLYKTLSVQKRAIQGWRYLEGDAAPKDRGLYLTGTDENEPPAAMAEELRRLGLL